MAKTSKEYFDLLNKVDPETGLPLAEADLTDDELRQRLEALSELGKTGVPVARGEIENSLKQMLPGYGITADTNHPIFKALVNFAERTQRLPNPAEMRDEVNAFGGNGQAVLGSSQIVNFLNDQDAKNRIAIPFQPKDYRLDTKRISDILQTRAGEAGKTAEEQKFLVETPEELRKSRERFLVEQEEAGGRQLSERVVPSVLQELNVRGLADSPDVYSEVARRGAGIQAGIESNIRDLEQQDAAFFADAAFRIQTAKLNQREADFRNSINLERERSRSEQESRFKTTQDRIGGDFEMDMLKREQERNLRLGKAGIDFESGSRSAEQSAANLGDIGAAAGQIIGTKIGTRTSKDTVNGTKQYSTMTPGLEKGR